MTEEFIATVVIVICYSTVILIQEYRINKMLDRIEVLEERKTL